MDSRLMAEFADLEPLLRAIRAMRERGYSRLEAYTPFPSPEVDEALGCRRSRLPYAIFVGGLLGVAGGYFLQWLLNAYLYPLDAGGRPPHFPLAFVPITFEMGVLLAGLTAFLGVLVLGGLVRLWHPVFETPGFRSATNDRFWLEVSSRDARFDKVVTVRELQQTHPLRLVEISG